MESIKIQKEIRDNCEELRDSLIDISKWEKEMKEKEKNLLNNSKNEEIPPIRTLNQQQSQIKESPSGAKKGPSNSPQNVEINEKSELKNRANQCKEKGNFHVKIGEYDKAIYCYTDAINIFNTDPIFYTNRALCYLKLERYHDCIEDCNRALRLSYKTIKALYRRMQAHESLGENDKALQDCKKILEIEPKNAEANKSLERITKKLQKNGNRDQLKETPSASGKPTFTELKSNMKVINTMSKPAHLRSKKALKRIAIGETVGSPVSSIKDTKNVENSSIAYSHISDEVIDKLFNSNEYANYKQVHKKQKTPSSAPSSKTPTLTPSSKTPSSTPLINKNDVVKQHQNLPPVPQTTGQFYATWKELSRENKYLYLRNIEPSNINKILGAGLDSETLADILGIMSEYYIKNHADVHKILFELSKHSEVAILSLFLSEDDRSALRKLLTYMQERKDSENDIVSIKSKFNVA